MVLHNFADALEEANHMLLKAFEADAEKMTAHNLFNLLFISYTLYLTC